MSKFFDIFSSKKEKKEELRIIVDHREKNSLVVSELIKLGFKIEFKQLPIADYLINGTAVERKTLADFKSSIINKRITQQLLEIKQYPQHLLILEGLESEDPYSGAIHENAFRGFLLSVALEYKVPVIFTLNEKDTAKYIYVLARKKEKSEISIRASKSRLSDKEQLQFILEGFPNIGPATAKKLLNNYKTIKQISNASQEDLEKLIGKKAILLHKFLNYHYL